MPLRPVPPATRYLLAAAMVVIWWMLGGCTAPKAQTPALPDETPPASPFAACPAAPGGGASSGNLPALTLDCFTGGQAVDLRSLVASAGKPAVVNLWASWCSPCRGELPALQAFADETGGKVLVLGVDTGDGWNAGAWAGIGFGVHYPNLYDPDSSLQKALGRDALPVSLFVAADGSVRATDVSGTLTLDKLRALAAANLGVSQ